MDKKEVLSILNNQNINIQGIYKILNAYAIEHDKELSPDLFNKMQRLVGTDSTGHLVQGQEEIRIALDLSLDYFKSKFNIVELSKENTTVLGTRKKTIKYY